MGNILYSLLYTGILKFWLYNTRHKLTQCHYMGPNIDPGPAEGQCLIIKNIVSLSYYQNRFLEHSIMDYTIAYHTQCIILYKPFYIAIL